MPRDVAACTIEPVLGLSDLLVESPQLYGGEHVERAIVNGRFDERTGRLECRPADVFFAVLTTT